MTIIRAKLPLKYTLGGDDDDVVVSESGTVLVDVVVDANVAILRFDSPRTALAVSRAGMA